SQQSTVVHSTNDSVLFCSAKTTIELEQKLNSDLQNLSRCPLNRVGSFKYLVNQRLDIIRRVKHLLTVESRRTLVNSLVMPIFDYADFVWVSSASESLRSLNWQPLTSLSNHAQGSFPATTLETNRTYIWNAAPLKITFHGTHSCAALRSRFAYIVRTHTDREDGQKSLSIRTDRLAYMLMHGVYSDALCIHTPSKMDPTHPDSSDEECVGNASFLSSLSDVKEDDPRKNLNDTWLKWKKFQPLWKIRNYFGEQIALYFAWLGLLVSSLWIPMVIGLTVALWGFTNAIEESKNGNDTLSVGETVQGWLRDSFDNDATPFFALIICLWGTIFLELWKRKTAELAYQWDVSDFEEQEPNRPQFYGTEIQK
ncbi:Hypothetical predicted protein, partial [Paramuricea clavata]